MGSESPYELNRVLNAWDLILIGIGAIIGAGLFSITGIAAAQHAGPAIALSFFIASLGCLFAGLCYSELASMFPKSGSAYTYAYASMGQFTAWLIGWTLILEYAIGASTVAISWSAYIQNLLQELGIYLPEAISSSPWQEITTKEGKRVYGIINLPAIFIVIVLSWLLILGVKESTRVNAVIVILKLTAVFLFIIFGFFYINPENLFPFIPPNQGKFGEFGISGVLRAAGMIFFAYIGFDAVSTSAQEVNNPSKNIPIGILGSLFICTTIYVLFSFVLTGLESYHHLNVAAPVALAIQKIPFPWLKWTINLAILAGFTSVILIMLFGQSRIFYAMAKDNMLPQAFSRLHPKYRTPWISHLILMLFASGISGLFPLAVIGNITSIGTLFAFVIVCAGVLILRYTKPELPRPFKTPFSPFIPLMGIVVCLIMMVSLEFATWLRLIIWLVLGLVIYVLYSRRKLKKI